MKGAFNSIKVRLKRSGHHYRLDELCFLFHKGAIETVGGRAGL